MSKGKTIHMPFGSIDDIDKESAPENTELRDDTKGNLPDYYIGETEDFKKIRSQVATDFDFFIEPIGFSICIKKPQRAEKIGKVLVENSRISLNNFAEVLSAGKEAKKMGINAGDFVILPHVPVQSTTRDGDHQVRASLRVITESLIPMGFKYEDDEGVKDILVYIIEAHETQGIIKGDTKIGKLLKYKYHNGD